MTLTLGPAPWSSPSDNLEETADTVAAMQLAREKGAHLVAICNAEGSQAARMADGALYMRSGLEVGVASTKTFIASLTILNLLAIYIGQSRGFLEPEATKKLVEEAVPVPPADRRNAGRIGGIPSTGREVRRL